MYGSTDHILNTAVTKHKLENLTNKQCIPLLLLPNIPVVWQLQVTSNEYIYVYDVINDNQLYAKLMVHACINCCTNSLLIACYIPPMAMVVKIA